MTWQLFTPDFDYEKQHYDVLTPEGEVVRCWPNAGMMHASDGSGRHFYACECEVRPSAEPNASSEPLPEPKPPTRSERQEARRERRRLKHHFRVYGGDTWVARGGR